jgi:hypothetical protein
MSVILSRMLNPAKPPAASIISTAVSKWNLNQRRLRLEVMGVWTLDFE